MSGFKQRDRESGDSQPLNPPPGLTAQTEEGNQINPLDFQHYALQTTLRRNYLVPLATLSSKIFLDVGSGTGTWGREICREFPRAQVIGFDIEEAVHDETQVRYKFVQGNLLQGLPFNANTFDYVHQRSLVGVIPATSWPYVIGELIRVTRPGGWIELAESSGEGFNPQGPFGAQFTEGLTKITAMRGIDLHIPPTLNHLMQQAGLINIATTTFQLPLGEWGKQAGILMEASIQAASYSFRDSFIRLLRYTPEAFDRLMQNVFKEWHEYHSHYTFYFQVSQKPGK